MNPHNVSLIRSLKGAPASIIMALVFCGHALTNGQLEKYTGYSDKPIARGLALLESLGFAQYNGFANGWSLTATAHKQLPLFNDDQLDDGGQMDDGGHRRNNSGSGNIPTSSSSSSDTYEEEKKSTDEWLRQLAASSPVDNSVDNVRSLLIAAGVGQRSVKLREIVALDLPTDYVKKHIAARAAALAAGEHYPVGWLITKLLDGDPVPQPPTPRTTIPPEYADIVKR